MSILSPAFLFLLLPLCLAAFYTIGSRYKEAGALGVILAGSIIYAQSQQGWFFAFFLISLLVNMFFVTRLISGAAGKWWVLPLGIIINLLALSLFKYGGLLDRVGFAEFGFRQVENLIPITISFLTFQRLASLVDAQENKQHLEGSIGVLRYGAFASFFPNLLIGPIAYLQEILGQFRRSDFGKLRYINIAIGLTLIAIGLFKKTFVADQIGASFVDPVWVALGNGFEISAADALLAILAYLVQLYFDFSGYSDIAIGVARLFGIILPTNFYSPLRAVGIVDFYRRWHIGLTRIIARFLYSPLSIFGTRFSMQRRWRDVRGKMLGLWLPLIVNFLVIGIWHGAKMTFVVFGIFHGLWYVFETEIRSTKRWKRFAKSSKGEIREGLGRAFTLPLLAVTFSLFRAPNLNSFQSIMGNAIEGDFRIGFNVIAPSVLDFLILVAAYLIVFVLPNSHEFLRRYRPGILTYDVQTYTTSKMSFL